MSLKFVKAEKNHQCHRCSRRIPAGKECWQKKKEGRKTLYEHTSCVAYVDQPIVDVNGNTPH